MDQERPATEPLLPLLVVPRDGSAADPPSPPPRWRLTARAWQLLAALIIGALAGGLLADRHPATTDRPANRSIEPRLEVLALGRLVPAGELLTLAAPFGTGDARVAELLVNEGDQVPAGTPLVRFDNASVLEAALAVAEKQVVSRKAALVQAERAVAFSQIDSATARAQARAAALAAEAEYQRWLALVDEGFVSPAAVDTRRVQRDEAVEAQRRAEAQVARHAGDGADQPELHAARLAVELAVAERDRARDDLERALLRAPADGTVVAIRSHPGERPGSDGVLAFGDTRTMTAEVEVYQSDVPKLQIGQRATLHSPALPKPLEGTLTRIGLSVGRQRLIDSSPAANVDARVVTATFTLDEADSRLAARLVGLEVQARLHLDPS